MSKVERSSNDAKLSQLFPKSKTFGYYQNYKNKGFEPTTTGAQVQPSTFKAATVALVV